ncbi:winged helix-turn-helix domain-containing protein [Kribbella deserti]|uniref:Winged helix-turn-helix domain-containing protein n=1 Tax=Kribbella deserti TaxID=1926257 RepID=A0ABV6QV33_9ACTN
MMHIEFTAADLARTRILPTLGPFAETALGVGSVRMTGRPTAPWRAAIRGASARELAELSLFYCPTPHIQLDLFSRVGPAEDFGTGAEAVLAIPERSFRDEVEVARCRFTPSWLRGIERAELPARRRMVSVLDRLHRDTVAPHWSAISTALGMEKARLARVLADEGVEGLLSSLHPRISWESPVLEIPSAGGWSREPLFTRLDGGGLVVVPSVFCAAGPVPYFPHDGQPAVLIYPIASDALWTSTASSTALATLLGKTRASVLQAIDEGCTTTELARRVGVSPASASQHATALRDAGLVTSVRDRNKMQHGLTPLGQAVLDRALH